ncbi:MAG: translesion error-prone DNA polymerase V autoproteolytic subunit [Cyanobacteria bacterium J06648_11]
MITVTVFILEKHVVGKHGGRREGAGRKKGVGSQVRRIPTPLLEVVDGLLASHRLSLNDEITRVKAAAPAPAKVERPLFSSLVSAGFPSPADDYVETFLDLNDYLVEQPSATFHVRVSGDSMIGAGIVSGDILVVNRALDARHNAIVIAVVDGEPTVKRLHWQGKTIELRPENQEYPTIAITSDRQLEIWGVVTGVVRKL